MKVNAYALLAFALLHLHTAASQDAQIPLAHVMKEVSSALDRLNTRHYKAQMRTQDMGSDTFDVRNFIISYRKNSSNYLYGYDWEIAESMARGTFTYMVLPQSLYTIRDFSGSRAVFYQTMMERPMLGNYIWTIWDYFILDEVIAPFVDSTAINATIVDSSDHLYITRQVNDVSTLSMVLDKKNYLPVKSVSTIRDNDLDLEQVITIDFTFDRNVAQLPDTAFSPEHYVSIGYEFIIVEDKDVESKEKPTSFSQESLGLLLSYPFLTEKEDTVYLSDSLSDYILLDFWYASCLPCLKSMPEVNQLAEEFDTLGLKVVGINGFDSEIRAGLVKKLRDKQINYDLLFSPRSLVDSIGIRSFPTYILVTPEREFIKIGSTISEIRNILEDLFH